MGNKNPNTKREYRISFIFTTCILATGILLQLLTGNFNIYLLSFPVNLILAVIIVLTTTGLAIYNKSSFFRWFSGIPLSVTLSGALIVLSLIMGFIPQSPPILTPNTEIAQSATWLSTITSSWPFVLTYFLILLNLACVIARRLFNFRIRDYGFYLNHIGLWIILLAAGLGSSDIETYNIKVFKGETAHEGFTPDGLIRHLPFSLRLDAFTVEEYDPKLIIVDDSFSTVLPEGKPGNIQIEGNGTKGQLLNWEIEVVEYYPRAVRYQTAIPYPVDMPGGSEAAFVKAANHRTGKSAQGWLQRGNPYQEPLYLKLEQDGWLLINDPEPKQFISEINLATYEVQDVTATIEVNKPFRFGDWMIYQSGYDKKAGRYSEYSIFMAVYDPWLNFVYAGIILLAAGSVSMLWSGRKKRNKQ